MSQDLLQLAGVLPHRLVRVHHLALALGDLEGPVQVGVSVEGRFLDLAPNI